MDDSISRQAAIDAVHKAIFKFFDIVEDDSESPMTYQDKRLLELNKSITQKIKALPSVDAGWIPVTEKLPEKFQTCIVTDEWRQCAYEYDYNPENEFTKKYGWRYNGRKIIAWMPLPDPYKERTDEL